MTSLAARAVFVLAALAAGTFHIAFLFPWAWPLVFGHLGALFALRRVPSSRWAFYTGLVIGLAIHGPHLAFFVTIFGPVGTVLWLILAFWHALFLLGLRTVHRRWGTLAALGFAPVLWVGLEYFRSELYPLRFAWLTLGSTLPLPAGAPWLRAYGVYGIAAPLFLLAAVLTTRLETRQVISSPPAPRWTRRAGLVATAALLWPALLFRPLGPTGPHPHVPVAGVQLEFPGAPEVLLHLREIEQKHPEAELVVLSEYTFDGPIPNSIQSWCRRARRWLIAGGKDPLEGERFYNTAFVVSPAGEVVFRQAKSVPIQFFRDGLPAPRQEVWSSPWGPIGICVCYDLNYRRVIDPLVRAGARALIVPTMDVTTWGRHEHDLNARMAAIRAAEHALPLFRVASSGISQLLDAQGRCVRQAGFPGQGETLAGALQFGTSGSSWLPLDRFLAPASVGATAAVFLGLAGQRMLRTGAPRPGLPFSPIWRRKKGRL